MHVSSEQKSLPTRGDLDDDERSIFLHFSWPKKEEWDVQLFSLIYEQRFEILVRKIFTTNLDNLISQPESCVGGGEATLLADSGNCCR